VPSDIGAHSGAKRMYVLPRTHLRTHPRMHASSHARARAHACMHCTDIAMTEHAACSALRSGLRQGCEPKTTASLNSHIVRSVCVVCCLRLCHSVACTPSVLESHALALRLPLVELSRCHVPLDLRPLYGRSGSGSVCACDWTAADALTRAFVRTALRCAALRCAALRPLLAMVSSQCEQQRDQRRQTLHH
jgi:hypothetical protein